MAVWEICLIGVALAMDAFAVGMTDGMTEPNMKPWKMFLIAAFFGAFQFLMPVAGYYFGSIFTHIVQKIAPWLSFAILALLGGKSIFDFFMELKNKDAEKKPSKGATVLQLFVQAIATSIDALAVGVAFLATETDVGLPFPVVFCALIIGAVTFALSTAAVFLGRKAGDKFSDKARLIGGVILIAIGLKILIEGLVG